MTWNSSIKSLVGINILQTLHRSIAGRHDVELQPLLHCQPQTPGQQLNHHAPSTRSGSSPYPRVQCVNCPSADIAFRNEEDEIFKAEGLEDEQELGQPAKRGSGGHDDDLFAEDKMEIRVRRMRRPRGTQLQNLKTKSSSRNANLSGGSNPTADITITVSKQQHKSRSSISQF